MTAAKFVELVEDMRIAQRQYFADRTRENLRETKRLEKEVDDAIEEFAARGKQGKLF